MAFELIKKGMKGGLQIEPDMISISSTTISFGDDILKKFGKRIYVEIYFDRKNKKVGFKATNSFITGFKLQTKNSRSISTTSAKRITKGRYKSREENDFIVIEVPEIVAEDTTIIREAHKGEENEHS